MLGWGWTVKVQTNAGTEAGFPDDLFVAAGAEIVADAARPTTPTSSYG